MVSVLVVGAVGQGPHILTVQSSEALAIIEGLAGFQWTQFTVEVWPSSVHRGVSFCLCHMYTNLSET